MALTDLDPPSPSMAGPALADPRSPVVRWILVLLTAVVLPASLVTLVAVRSTGLSRLDEAAHLDYLRKVERGDIPRVGDRVDQETVRDVVCRSVDVPDDPRCDLPLDQLDPAIAGAEGYSYEAQQPPLYYAVTAVLRRFTNQGPVDDFVLSARLTGFVWIVAGFLAFWAAARRLRVGWWSTAALCALLAASPLVVYQAGTVTNDAAAILTGSLALLLFADLRERTDWRRVALWSAVAVLLVLVKPTGIIAVAAAVGALLVDALADRRWQPRVALRHVVPVLAGLVAYVGWSWVRTHRAFVDYDVVLHALLSFKQVDSWPTGDIVANVSELLRAFSDDRLRIAPGYVAGPALLASYALIGAAFVGLWLRRGGQPPQRAAGVALAALVVGGPAFTVLFYLDYSIGGGPHPRYGLSLLPVLAAGAAVTFCTRRSVAALAAMGALMVGSLTVALV